MKIINELMKQDTAHSIGGYSRMLKGIEAGDFRLSIQGSDGHYCSPRKTLEVFNYAEMEVAIFRNNDWVFINHEDSFKSFPRYDELLERADSLDGGTQVFAYVPMDLINDLYIFLSEIKEKANG